MKRLLKIIIIAFLSICLVAILKSCRPEIKLPIVTTKNVIGITQTSAVSGGNVTNNGGAEVSDRGICWGTASGPTTSSSKADGGKGNGPFDSSITGLTANNKYFVRAYATNIEGTSFGNEVSFTTLENPPVAAFTASPTTITAGQSVQFTDQSTNTPTSWSWNFGDGSTSTSQSPSHIYSATGTYTVTLAATNSSGSDTETKSNYIKVNPIVIAPVAAFTASPTTITAGQSVQFTDQSTNTPTSWSWNFGDGSTSTSQSPSHVYSAAGTYTVSLTATNSAGSDTETKSNYIKVNPVVNAPVAAFTASSTTITAGQSVQFTDQSTNTPASWSWNFGDGSTSTSQSPSHTYSTAGTYTVSLTATNSAGSDIETKSNYIKVNPVVKVTLTTNAVMLITSTTAESGGNISSDGGGPITERGVCWNTSGDPTILNERTINGTGTGSFTSNLTGLFDGTTYFVRAYAINGAGTAYGEEYSFITPVTDKEGNVYKTVKIGSQVWMAENLKATMLNDNISIPYIADDNTWFNLTTMGYCWYDNQSSYKDIYGALYNWYTVNSGRLCPSGWHIPADYEWTELVTFVGGGRYSESVENANKLKETGYEHWDISCPEGTNISGFSARPGGIRFGYYYSDNKCFETLHNTAWWWTVTVMSNDRRWCYFVFCNGLQGTNYLRTCGMSVRCLKD